MHEVAQEIAPESRVVYVDNDPIVLVHARALMAGTTEGPVAYIQADLREPEAILDDPAVAGPSTSPSRSAWCSSGSCTISVTTTTPAGSSPPWSTRWPPGSYLVLSQTTPDFDPEAMRALAAASEQGGIPNVPRSLADTEPFFAGLELVEPGLVPLAAWRPDPGAGQDPRSVYAYGGVARKP